MTKSILALLLLSIATLCRAATGDGGIVKVGQTAPNFSGVATDGATVELKSLAGKVVLLNFFATWCGPCMQEMPRIESEIWKSKKFRDAGVVVLAVGREHGVDELKKFKESKRLTFQILADPKREIYSKYAKEYIPRCYLIGKDGKIKYASMGFDPNDFEKLKSAIAAAIKK